MVAPRITPNEARLALMILGSKLADSPNTAFVIRQRVTELEADVRQLEKDAREYPRVCNPLLSPLSWSIPASKLLGTGPASLPWYVATSTAECERCGVLGYVNRMQASAPLGVIIDRALVAVWADGNGKPICEDCAEKGWPHEVDAYRASDGENGGEG